ncbi:MAG: sensor histidine kinase, partial [Acidimicrobiia bacterium]
HVRIDFGTDGSRLFLEVADDGSGFDPSSRSEGQGLSSMRRRAERLGATFEVSSRPGGGTIVRVKVPVAGSRHAPYRNV